MSATQNRYKIRKQAIDVINKIFEYPQNVNVIHYSCEDFNKTREGNSPRIASIVVRNLQHEQTTSFSILKTAEKMNISINEIDSQYSTLERKTLDEFYNFVKMSNNFDWLHWNMRDEKYGFPTIAHRYEVLGGTSHPIPNNRTHNLAALLVDIYGDNYVNHDRLYNLYQLNTTSQKKVFLTGQEEVDAFNKREFLKLQNSTLKKVDVIASFAKSLYTGKLKTNSNLFDIYGTNIKAWIDYLLESTPYKTISFIIIIFNIIQFIIFLKTISE